MFATGTSPADLIEMARRELVPRRLFGDVAWPRHSLIRGRRAELTQARLFGGALIEDQRRRMFAVSVDLVAARQVSCTSTAACWTTCRWRTWLRRGVAVLAVDVAQPFDIRSFGTEPRGLPPIVDTSVA